MRKFGRIYIEITNICNLNCSFCHGTSRKKESMTAEDFELYLEKIKGYTDLVFLHLMGEPLTHPELDKILSLTEKHNLRTVITTNGTLLSGKSGILFSHNIYRVNISLHSFEGNNSRQRIDEYVNSCISFADKAEKTKVCFRLWNGGGENEMNDEIHSLLHSAFPGEWKKIRKGFCLKENVFIEYADRFDWPDFGNKELGEDVFCYGLRDQLGILADGTVVPCCLDCDGKIALGNLKEQSLEEIINSPRATKIYDGFSRRKAVEELCGKCNVNQHLN